jgi:FlaA1/EpsC-like NDP-sugar epimerase
MLAGDTCLSAAAYVLAYLIRFEGNIPMDQTALMMESLPWVVIVKMAAYSWFDLYRGMWRYTGLIDFQNVLKAASSATAIVVLAVLMLRRFEGYSRSVFILDWGLTLFLIGGIRVTIRVLMTGEPRSFLRRAWTRVPSRGLKRLLLVGAGDAGEKFLREIRDNPRVRYLPVGFLDDDSRKQGKTIHGVPVLGPIDEIMHYSHLFDEILIATPSARGEQMRRIVETCEATGKPYRTIPTIGELIEGRITVNTIREVSMEDLIGREKVQLDENRISAFLHRKRVLITGAGGSIGAELVRQIGRYLPEELVLLDFNEFNLYRIEMDCRQRKSGTAAVHTILADIRDRELMMRIFERHKPHVVFHAAAYKHVPMQEYHPCEALKTNVLGTQNVAEAAIFCGASHFVLVSTDKAVRPTNVMGATKRLAEMLIQGIQNTSPTHFMAVRFGNVIGSSGSVIPLFQQQIAQGGPVTVTHPDITRYFMSIPEAAQLILQAGAMGEGGEIFVLDMGKPVRIMDVARDLIRLNGLVPGEDITIEFIGLRPGEKLYEELITDGEGIVPTGHPKVMVLKGVLPDGEVLKDRIATLLCVTDSGNDTELRNRLQKIVPEYQPSGPDAIIREPVLAP